MADKRIHLGALAGGALGHVERLKRLVALACRLCGLHDVGRLAGLHRDLRGLPSPVKLPADNGRVEKHVDEKVGCAHDKATLVRLAVGIQVIAVLDVVRLPENLTGRVYLRLVPAVLPCGLVKDRTPRVPVEDVAPCALDRMPLGLVLGGSDRVRLVSDIEGSAKAVLHVVERDAEGMEPRSNGPRGLRPPVRPLRFVAGCSPNGCGLLKPLLLLRTGLEVAGPENLLRVLDLHPGKRFRTVQRGGSSGGGDVIGIRRLLRRVGRNVPIPHCVFSCGLAISYLQ